MTETIQHLERPIWRSKKHLALIFVGLLLVGLQQLGAPESVTSKLADAIWWGLPALIAGQSWIDAKVRPELLARLPGARPGGQP